MPHQFILYLILGINIFIFLLQLIGLNELTYLGALYSPSSTLYHHWQWFSHFFLHNSLLHLLMNMFAIYTFGAPVLASMRVWKFALLYVLGGVIGGVVYILTLSNQVIYTPIIGASGAAFALLAAFAIRFPQAKIGIFFLPLEWNARYFTLALVIYEIFAQFTGISLLGANIAHMAHVGGAITGATLAWLWRKRHIRLLH